MLRLLDLLVMTANPEGALSKARAELRDVTTLEVVSGPRRATGLVEKAL